MPIDNSMLKERFGISYPRPYQELIISYIMEGAEGKTRGHVLGVLPTGSGKSLCFMYPIAKLRRRAVLIYPLLSLMNDQGKRFEEAGIPFVILRGGLDREERARRLQRIREDDDVSVITNIETLIAMDNRGELGILARDTLMAVVDEAHTAPLWGETFREAYTHIGEILEKISPQLILAFTATADSRIYQGIRKYIFGGNDPYIVHGSIDRENIFYHSVRSLSKIHDIISILAPPSSRPAIIFCRSRRLSEEISGRLKGIFPIEHYHAGLPKEEKEEKERWFCSSADGVLAATSAYGMGVDKKNIRTVIHFSLPDDASSFIQESGRGGRDGERMDSYVLYSKNEDSPLSAIFKGKECIRSSLLSLMGEERNGMKCLSCSHCMGDGYTAAGEKEILSFIRHHPLISAESAARALTAKHLLFRRRRLPSWNENEAEHAVEALIAEGRIRKLLARFLIVRTGSGS